ncbi:MAG: hypothetical protein LM577_07260, partial [Thermoproteaceae archaeon]|nr:hypothetical protein [Thermoproteaceae archaeon]
MQHQIKAVLPLLAVIALALIAIPAWAQVTGTTPAGSYQPVEVKLVLGIADDRWIKNRIAPELTNMAAWETMRAGYFAAGKNFTLIIRDLNQLADLDRFHDFRTSFVANETGFGEIRLKVYPKEMSISTTWYVALALNDWPEKGYTWLVYNATAEDITILDVLYCLGGNIKAPPNIEKPKDCIERFWSGRIYWGNITRSFNWTAGRIIDNYNYTIVHSAAIHLWFLNVSYIKNVDYKVTVKFLIGTKNYTLYQDVEENKTLTSRLDITERGRAFGPFFYVASQVRTLRGKGEVVTPGDMDDSPKKLYVDVNAQVELRDGRLVTRVISYEGSVVRQRTPQTVLSLTLPYEFTAYDFRRMQGVGLEGGIVVEWDVPSVNLIVRSAFDLKSNPVLLPEYITLKLQVKTGDRWVEWDYAQMGWRAGIWDIRDVIVTMCGPLVDKKDRPLKEFTIGDLLRCYERLRREDFVRNITQLYRPAHLSYIAGWLKLTDDSFEVKTTDTAITAKLVAEFYYPEAGAAASAVVGTFPVALKELPAGIKPALTVTLRNITVALLPASITLYQFTNETLPHGYPLTIASALPNVKFVVEGAGFYFEKVGLEAVTKNPWTGAIMLALPPYEVPPMMVGGEKLHPLSLFNASGYLPVTPIYGVVCIKYSNVTYFNVTDVVDGKSVQVCDLGVKNLRSYFEGYTSIVSGQNFKIEAFLGGIRVGVAHLASGAYNIRRNGTLIETQENLEKALKAEYYVRGRDLGLVRAVYNFEVTPGWGRLFRVQHWVYMAITVMTLNVLPRDLCGSPLPGGLLRVIVSSDTGSYEQKVSLGKYQYEVPVQLSLPLDETGLITVKHVEVSGVMDYYGYELKSVNRSTLEPATVKVPVKKLTPKVKPELYFPVSPLLFSVWGKTPEGVRKDRLSGFAVSAYSTKMRLAAGEISRSISNLTKYSEPVSDRYGYAYIEGAPIGEEYPFRVVVRTLVPEEDADYPYSLAQIERRNAYWTYWLDMVGGHEGVSFVGSVYTLGTRGPVDAGVVVYNRTMVLTAQNFTQYVCARSDIPLDVEVYDLEVRVLDKTGRYLLNATEAFFGPYPLASDKRVVPVALVIPDTEAYTESSRVYVSGGQIYPYIPVSYTVLGLTGVRDRLKAAAREYFDKMRDAISDYCTKAAPVNWTRAVYNYSYAAFYNYVANASTYGREAVFRISSVQPKYVPYVCDMTPDVPGAREFARLFLRGQRYRLQVWYLGYKVFDGSVTVTSPRINITTDAVPVRIETVTKSGRMPVDAYVAFTFADALAGLAYVSNDVLPAKKVEAARALLRPFDYLAPLPAERNVLLVKDPERDYVYYSPTVVYRRPDRNWTLGIRMPFTAGIEYSLPWAVMVYRNLTDVEGADITPERRAYYPRDGVIYGAVYLLVIETKRVPVEFRMEFKERVWNNKTYTAYYVLNITVTGIAYPEVVKTVTNTEVRSIVIRAAVPPGGTGTAKVVGVNYTNAPRAYEQVFNETVIINATARTPAELAAIEVGSDRIFISIVSRQPLQPGYILVQVNASSRAYEKVVVKEEERPVPTVFGEYIVGLRRWINVYEDGRMVYYDAWPNLTLADPLTGLVNWLKKERNKAVTTLEFDDVDKVYRKEITLKTYDKGSQTFELLTYRTVSIKVPSLERCYVGGIKSGAIEVRRYTAVLRVEARFAKNDTLIDKAEINLSERVRDSIEETPGVTVPLLFGKVAAIARYVDPDTGDGETIKFKFELEVRDEEGNKVKYGTYCKGEDKFGTWNLVLTARMPAEVYYDVGRAGHRWITTEGARPEADKYTIYTTAVYEYENATDGAAWRVVAALPRLRVDADWTGRFGFGAPITVEFKAGDVAVLPAWASNTAGYGSRIARIWLYVYDNKTKPDRLIEARVKVVNFVPSVNSWKVIRTYLNEFASAEGPGDLWGLGFMTSGTSAVVYTAIGLAGRFGEIDYSAYRGYAFWNSTELSALAQKLGGSIKLPAAALDEVEVANAADYPVIIAGVKVKEADVKVPVLVDGRPAWISEEAIMIPVREPVRVDVAGTGKALLRGYGFGMTYDINGTGKAWRYQLVKNAPNYTAAVYYGACDDAVRYFARVDPALADKAAEVCGRLEPLTGPYVPQTVLYASHHEEKPKYFTVSGVVMDGRTVAPAQLVTKGEWRKFKLVDTEFKEIKLVIWSNDTAYKYLFELPKLPLVSVRDWNDRALANQTVALFGVNKDGEVHLYAITYTTSAGTLRYPLPNITGMPDIVRAIVKVSWFFGYLHELATGQTQYTIWVYDSGVENDVQQLGDALTKDKVRTYVYPLAATVTDELGRPLANMYVKVLDVQTRGALVTAMNKTDSTGTTKVFDERVSKYPTGPMSQIPAADYEYYIYDETGMLVATGTYSIQRGATVPAEGWNIRATVRYVYEIPVRNAGTRGYVRVYNIRVVDPRTGEERIGNITVPFVIAEGVMRLERRIPALAAYPVEVYVTHATVGGEEVPLKKEWLAFKGRASDLLAGLDFAELGVTGIVTASAVDAAGKVRPDWVVRLETTVNGRTITAAEGRGSLRAVVPRSAVIGANYTVRVITTAMTPAGAPLVREVPLNVTEKAHALEVPVRTVAVAVQAVDGFGKVRSD